MPIDISHLNSHIENIDHALKIVNNLCKQTMLVEIDCHNTLEPLAVRYNDMYKEFNSISHLINKRTKRAWFGGIGPIIKHVFCIW